MHRCFALFCLLLTAAKAWGAPPEGLESFGIFNRSVPAATYAAAASYSAPAWAHSYGSVYAYATLPTEEGNLWTFGASGAVISESEERSAYFLRHDHMVGELASVSLKYSHEDWWFINSGKDTVSFDVNMMFAAEARVGFYLSFGVYYRWLKQSWNSARHIPLTFATNDHEGYLEGCFGYQGEWGAGFYTVDVNNRDTFSIYHGDNIGIDYTYNIEVDREMYLRLLAGVRMSALLAGTAYPASYNFSVGLLW